MIQEIDAVKCGIEVRVKSGRSAFKLAPVKPELNCAESIRWKKVQRHSKRPFVGQNYAM